jgi:hypothetical protein
MEGKPRCKKCGRVLKSPASIARGLGPKCAGVSPESGKSVHTRNKWSSGKPYQSVGSSNMQTPLFPSDFLTKPYSKRELQRRRREERRRLFETREPFQCGMLLPRRSALIYEPVDNGNWKENPSGRIISHKRLQEYLKRYHFI